MQGDPNANANLAMMRDRISSDEADAAQTAAVEWVNKQAAG